MKERALFFFVANVQSHLLVKLRTTRTYLVTLGLRISLRVVV